MTDQEVAAWIPTVCRGVPMWEALGENTRVYWREAYARYLARKAAIDTLVGDTDLHDKACIDPPKENTR